MPECVGTVCRLQKKEGAQPPPLLSFLQCNPDAIPRLFADFGPDGFGDTEDVCRCFHAYEAAVVGLAVKCCMNLDTALAEFLPDIIGKVNVCPIHVRNASTIT